MSALERKDEGELTLLRAVHEDTILTLVKSQKERVVAEAKEAEKLLTATQKGIQMRFDHYNGLIEGVTDPELGLNKEEVDGLGFMADSKKSSGLPW